MCLRRKTVRRAKSHRNYTIQEIAELRAVHPNTVTGWINSGLRVIDDNRPKLILGRELNAFLEARSKKNKRPCQPGEIYCVRCRAAKFPAGAMADFQPQGRSAGRLVGICPTCERLMYQNCGNTKLAAIRAVLDITITTVPVHIVDSTLSLVNSDLGKED